MKRPIWTAAVCLAAFLAVWLRFLFVPSESLTVVCRDGGTYSVEEGDSCVVMGRVKKTELKEYTDYSTLWIYLESVTIEVLEAMADVSASGDATSASALGVVTDASDAGDAISASALGTAANVSASGVSDGEFAGKISCMLICQTDGEVRPKVGSWVRVSGKFSYFTQATNPGQFDLRQYYRILGVGGRIKSAKLLEVSQNYDFLGEGLFLLREHWKERIYACYPRETASVLCTVLLGDRTGLDAELKSLYQRNGIIHILSISGLHITLIGMGLYGLLRKIGCPGLAAALASGVALVLYGLMVGMPVSACRAIGMYLLRMLGEMLGRTYDMLTALGVMGIVLLLMQPEYLLYGGFLLSFGSLAGIALLLPVLQLQTEQKSGGEGGVWERVKGLWGESGEVTIGRVPAGRVSADEAHTCGETASGWKSLWRPQNGWKLFPKGLLGRLWGLLVPGLSILLFTLPFQLYFYYEVPVYSVFLNLLILPFFSLVVGTGLCVMLLPCTGWLSCVAIVILSGYEKLCLWFDTFPFHTWTPGAPDIWQMIVYYMLLLAFIGLRAKMQDGREETGRNIYATVTGKDQRRKKDIAKNLWKAQEEFSLAGKPGTDRHFLKIWQRVLLLLPIAGVLILGLRIHGGLSVTFLDVGQGDGIVLQTQGGEVYLFDCGSTSTQSVGEYTLIPFLKYSGITHIDGVFLSHPDKDHYSGILELLELGATEGITVDRLFLPDIAENLRGEEFGTVLQAWEACPREERPLLQYLGRGAVWRSGETVITCLHPEKDSQLTDANAYSQCFLVQNGDFSMLLTGDVEGEGETQLTEALRELGVGDLTLLKVAHHGSRNSTSAALLAILTPRLAVISCGRDNSYGHPHEELLERLEEVGTENYITAQIGAVTVTVNDRVRIQGYLE